jgi:hypothetical protein
MIGFGARGRCRPAPQATPQLLRPPETAPAAGCRDRHRHAAIVKNTMMRLIRNWYSGYSVTSILNRDNTNWY